MNYFTHKKPLKGATRDISNSIKHRAGNRDLYSYQRPSRTAELVRTQNDPTIIIMRRNGNNESPLPQPAPNSKPRDPVPKTYNETYVYRDFANVDIENGAASAATAGEEQRLHPKSLQSQKLPSKLGGMLSDPGEYEKSMMIDDTSHVEYL